MNAMNSLNPHTSRMNSNDLDAASEALLFSKLANPQMNPNQGNGDALGRSVQPQNQYDNHGDIATSLANMVNRTSLMYRDGLDAIKTEPEPILN